MKRSALVRHLVAHGCELWGEGARHSLWINPATGRKEAIPRHQEIGNIIARAICRSLSIPPPPG